MEELTIKIFETYPKISALQEKVDEQLSLATQNKNFDDAKLLNKFNSEIKDLFNNFERISRALNSYKHSCDFDFRDLECRKRDLSERVISLKKSYIFLKNDNLKISRKLNIHQKDINDLLQHIDNHLLNLKNIEQYIVNCKEF